MSIHLTKTDKIIKDYINENRIKEYNYNKMMFSGDTPWVKRGYGVKTNTLKTLLREVTDITLSEVKKTEVQNEDTILRKITKNNKKIVHELIKQGEVLLKPFIYEGEVGVALYNKSFYTYKLDQFEDIREVTMINKPFSSILEEEEAQINKKIKPKVYVTIERHVYDRVNKTYTINHKLYNITEQVYVPLDTIVETSNLEEQITLTGVDRHLCKILTLSGDLTEESKSLFENTYPMIEELERIEKILLEELELSKKKLIIPDKFVKRDKIVLNEYTQQMENTGEKELIPEFKSENMELYTFIHVEDSMMGTQDQRINIDVFNPEIRSKQIIEILTEKKRSIEFTAGVPFGTLSKQNVNAKTATEVTSSKQRVYNTVNTIQQVLGQGVYDIYESISILLNYGKYQKQNIDLENGRIYFGDNILVTEEEETRRIIELTKEEIITKEEARLILQEKNYISNN